MHTMGKIEDVVEKAGQVMGGGTGGAILAHMGTNNVEKEGTSAIVGNVKLQKAIREVSKGNVL